MKFAYFGFDILVPCLRRLVDLGHMPIEIFIPACDNVYGFDTETLAMAEALSVPVVRRRPETSDLIRLTRNGCELIVSAGYPHRIPVETVDALRGVNVHFSLLPDGRGAWPVPWTILLGLVRTGVSVHKLSPAFDAGAVLAQEAFDVFGTDTIETVTFRCRRLATTLLEQCVSDLDRLWEGAIPQGEGVWWHVPRRADRTLMWAGSVWDVDRVARAFGRFGSLATIGDQKVLVRDVRVWSERHHYQPGDVVDRAHEGVVLAASDGLVCLRDFDALR